MFGLKSPSPRTINPSLATVCEQLETSVESFAEAAVQWADDEWGYDTLNGGALIADGEIRSVLTCIRTIQENCLWINYPRRLQTDVIVSFKGCIDSLDRQTASFSNSRSVPQTQQTADSAAQKFTKTFQDLKRDTKHHFEMLSAAEEIEPDLHQRRQEHNPVMNVSLLGQTASSAFPASVILWELVNEIKAMKIEVADLRATPPGRRPVGDSPPRIRLEQFLHAPAAFLNSLANPPFSISSQNLTTDVAGASLFSSGVSEIVAPPYELSESGRRQHGEWSSDGQRVHQHRGDWRMSMEQGGRSVGPSEGSPGALTPRSTSSVPLRPGSYSSPHIFHGDESSPSI